MNFIRDRSKGEMKNVIVQYYNEIKIYYDIYNDNNRMEKNKLMINHGKAFNKKLSLNNIEEIQICLNIAEANFEAYMNFEETEKNLEAVIKKENQIKNDGKNIFYIWVRIGKIYFKIQKYEKSEDFYIKCLEIQEQFPLFHSDLVTLYIIIKDLYNEKAD
ncbi:hypothetical protein SteCoe_39310 [Stentor coeruleus]|uniref:Uncharacterized protein n=1 Tax=Stentor coeruleus TaxID=5963 RepID=A0A1R2AKZ7_9CILI|nr:hypothetical protein SteCoe_39310 [Stentor coeruleus]